jgi:hypothetical protein
VLIALRLAKEKSKVMFRLTVAMQFVIRSNAVQRPWVVPMVISSYSFTVDAVRPDFRLLHLGFGSEFDPSAFSLSLDRSKLV